MLFTRRKRGTTSQPTENGSNGASLSEVRNEEPTAETPEVAPEPSAEPSATTDPGAPVVPVAAPTALPPLPSTTEVAPLAHDNALAPDEERADNDLDRFFAALRQVVHDAREQVTLEHDDAAPVASPVVDALAADVSRESGISPETESVPLRAAMSLARPDPLGAGTPATSSTELAPTTAELIASLEADRDLWRERAVVWRERAMGADMLIKTLNAHMSDLQINLEDLRLTMRVLTKDVPGAPPPRGELPPADLSWTGLDR